MGAKTQGPVGAFSQRRLRYGRDLGSGSGPLIGTPVGGRAGRNYLIKSVWFCLLGTLCARYYLYVFAIPLSRIDSSARRANQRANPDHNRWPALRAGPVRQGAQWPSTRRHGTASASPARFRVFIDIPHW